MQEQKTPNLIEVREKRDKWDRNFGEVDEHNHYEEKRNLNYAMFGLIAITIILSFFIAYGIFIIMLALIVTVALIPIYNFVIRIPMVVVLEVNLEDYSTTRKSKYPRGWDEKNIEVMPITEMPVYNYKTEIFRLIDKVNIYYIPWHLFKEDWEIVGNMPPFKSQTAGELVYIADKVDLENKVIQLPFSELFSNMRYVIHKKTFVELKREYMSYLVLEMRRLITQEITVGVRTRDMLIKVNNAIHKDMPKYILHQQFGTNPNDFLGTDEQQETNLNDIMNIRDKLEKMQKNNNQQQNQGDNK